MGTLRNFSTVSFVNKRLISKGWSFSSSYYRDKCILWKFDSVSNVDYFINNQYFWEDCFSSMVKWSKVCTPQSRLSWLLVSSTPLKFWSEKFFLKVGWMIGESLVMEEDTVLGTRYDMGKVLTLVPSDKKVAVNIKVE